MNIALIDYGAGNLMSVKYALNRIGLEPNITNVPEEIMSADKVIFPGVGQASSAMVELNKRGLPKVIKDLEQPLLGICLGMQLLCRFSEEGGTTGLGIIDVDVLKFSNAVKVPQIGWNTVGFDEIPLFQDVDKNSYSYFVHSYYVPLNEATIGRSVYGVEFTAALNKNNFYGVQFHPEKSGDVGNQILKNFIEL